VNGTSEEAIVEPAEAEFAGPWLVADRGYSSFVGRLFAAAQRRCLVSLFLVSAPWRDQERILEGLLLELARASRRGVDARLLVGAAPTRGETIRVAEAARGRAQMLGVPSRWLSSVPIVAGHSRVVVSDDNVLVGSQDGSGSSTPRPGPGQPDNVFVVSGSLARALERRFGQQWTLAADPPR
jgi:hypothetical protein